MQSIALVLSQTDFCAALGHLGQPSLASAALARNHFNAAILRSLKQKELKTSVILTSSFSLRTTQCHLKLQAGGRFGWFRQPSLIHNFHHLFATLLKILL